MQCKKSNECGFITVEATFALVIFIAVVACIVSLINIYTLHNRIQYAITQTANQLSTYMYIYDGLGIQDIVTDFDKNADKATEGINNAAQDGGNLVISAEDFGESLKDVLSSFNKIGESMGNVSNTIGSDFSAQSIQHLVDEFRQTRKAIDDTKQNVNDSKDKFNTMKEDFNTAKGSTSEFIKSVQENPYTLVLTVFYLAADNLEDGLKKTISENLASALTQQYLMGDDADRYLTGMSVVGGYEGLNFYGSNFFEPLTKAAEGKKYSSDSSRSLDVLCIDVVVQYKVKLDFPLVPLKDNTVTIIQNARTTAWTGHKNS